MRKAQKSAQPKKTAQRATARPGTAGSRTRRPALDTIDRRVVAALQADGRRAFASIADELSVAESVIRYRVQRMEKAGILQVVGIADPLKLGFDLMAMIGIRTQPGELRAVCAALTELPETSYVAAVAGHYDIFLEVVCRDTAHFQELLTDTVHAIPGVQSTESFLILEIHKMAYGWGAGEHGVPLADDVDDTDPGGAPASPTTNRPRARRTSGGEASAR